MTAVGQHYTSLSRASSGMTALSAARSGSVGQGARCRPTNDPCAVRGTSLKQRLVARRRASPVLASGDSGDSAVGRHAAPKIATSDSYPLPGGVAKPLFTDLKSGYVTLDGGLTRTTKIDLTGAGNIVLNERVAELRASEEEATRIQSKETRQQAAQTTPLAVLKEVLIFAVPALGSVLADPLMSLVDTACVGQYSSLHLAALAPNTSVFNIFFQIFTFLGYTTTNLIASNSIKAAGLSRTEIDNRRETASRILAHSMVMAVTFGLMSTSIMLLAGGPLLTAMGATPETLGPALSYLQIRALASPAVMVANVAQGACLGQQDSWTPLKVFATSGVVNLVLDMILINNFNMGIAGAAIATTFAQVTAASFFVWYCKMKGDKGEAVPLKWHGLPTLKSLAPFWDVANTLLSRTMFTCLAYTGVSTISTSMGFLAAASHQVALQVFWFLSYVPESLSLTAQSFIARDLHHQSKVRVIAKTLMQLGIATGVTLAALFSVSMLACPWLFSSDAAVHMGLQSTVIPGSLACLGVAVAMTFDGIGIGSGKFQHLPRNNFMGLLACMACAVTASQAGLGLAGTWTGFAAFMGVRVLGHIAAFAKNHSTGIFGHKEMSVKPAMA